jgi:hypothetical protein
MSADAITGLAIWGTALVVWTLIVVQIIRERRAR